MCLLAVAAESLFQSCKNPVWVLQTAVQSFPDQPFKSLIICYSNQTLWITFQCLTGTLNNTVLPQSCFSLDGILYVLEKWKKEKKSEADSFMRTLHAYNRWDKPFAFLTHVQLLAMCTVRAAAEVSGCMQYVPGEVRTRTPRGHVHAMTFTSWGHGESMNWSQVITAVWVYSRCAANTHTPKNRRRHVTFTELPA